MTKIPWCTKTWNPIKMRCTPISAGCANCWHLRMAKRLAGKPRQSRSMYCYAWSGDRGPMLDQRTLEAPLHWRKPQVVAVQLMGDLFHERVPAEFVNRIGHMMKDCQRHTFILLTKRPGRITEWIDPPLNVWLGVSVEDQQTADERIPILLQTPVARRWVSLEPMLGAVDLRVVPCHACNSLEDQIQWPCPHCKCRRFVWPDAVVLGGESGPRARPLNPDWVRSVRDQCAAAKVPFMFKQWGDNPSTKNTERLGHMVLGRNVLLPFIDGRVHAELGWGLA